MSDWIKKTEIVGIHNFHTTIDWHFGNHCQYACSYCPNYLHKGDSKKFDLEILKEFVISAEKNLKFSTSLKQIKFTFAGGEPTLNSSFGPLVKWLKSRGHVIDVVSNAGRTIRWWKEWGENFDDVVLSFHTEQTDLDHFIEVADYISKVTKVEAHIIAWPNQFDRIRQTYEQLSKIENLVTIVKRVNKSWVPDDSNFQDYTEEQSQWIDQNLKIGQSTFKNKKTFFIETSNGKILEDHPMVITNSNANNFFGWSCNQGISHLGVSVYGEVYGAHCKQLLMGSIYEPEKINWVKEPSLCRQVLCTCISDILITKTKN